MRPSFWFYALLGLFAIHLGANFLWLREGPCLYGKDVSLRLLANTRFHHELTKVVSRPGPLSDKVRRVAALFRVRLVPGVNIWTDDTKFGYFVNALIAIVAGNTPFTTLFICNSFWLLILLVSVYLIGRECGDVRSGWWSACFLSLYPALFGISRKFGLDLPQMAVVSLSMLFLMRSGNFRRLGSSILFGITVGLGYLVKNSNLIFIAGPWIYEVLAPPGRQGEIKGFSKRWLGFLMALALFLAVSWIWWGSPEFVRLMREWGIKHATERGYDSINPHGLLRYLFYPAYLAEFISPLFSILAVVAFVPFLSSGLKNKGLIISWLIVPLLILTVCRDKWGSWCLSLLPPLAIITACGLLNIQKRNLRRLLLMSGTCLAAVQFMGLSFGVGGVDNTLRLFGFNSGWYRWELDQTAQYHAWYHPPWKNNYQEVMGEFSHLMQPQKYLRVGIVERGENWRIEDAYILEYYLRLHHPECIIYESVSVARAFFSKYRCADYFIVLAPEGQVLPVRSDYPSLSDRDFDDLMRELGGCELVKTTTLQPKNFSITLYKRLPIIVTGVTDIPADSFYEGNIFVKHPIVGSDPAVGGELTAEEFDSPFPTRVWEKPAGELHYVVYKLFFPKAGRYRIAIHWEKSRLSTGISSFMDDIPLGEGNAIMISKGLHLLRIESRTEIPIFSSITCDNDGK